MKNNLITQVKSTFRPSDFFSIILCEALEKIRDGTYKVAIDSFRRLPEETATDKDTKAERKKMLPSFSFNGIFKDSVVNANLSDSSGLFHFDIDKLDDVAKHKELISQVPGIVFCFVSTSGTGLKGAIRIPHGIVKSDSDFKRVFSYFKSFFLNLGYAIDEQCKDVRRLCFVSYDPDIYINYDAIEIEPILDAEPVKRTEPFKTFKQDLNGSDSAFCINTVVKMLLNAVDGSRHGARFDAARVAGGYIAAGRVNENEIMAAIQHASDAIADKGTTSKAELKTLEDGIALGKTQPLYDKFDNRQSTISGKVVKPLVWEKPTYKIILNSQTGIKAYPGVMDAVVKQVLHFSNKPQPELTILSAIIGMAASIGGNYRLPGGGRFNLYGVGISGTGTGKDKAMTAGSLLAYHAGSENIGMPGSGAALEDSLSESGTKILLGIDEVAHFIAAMNDNKQTHMASLSGNLLKLFTASRGKYITRKLANSSNNSQKECINPCVSLLGFACPEKLGEAFGSGGNIDDGLIGRMLIVNGRDDVKPRRDKGEELHLHDSIADIAKRINCGGGVVGFSHEADLKLDALCEQFDVDGQSSTSPFAKNIKVRSYEKCERIAGVLAIWDCPENPVIELDHVLWAEAFINHSDNEIIKFVNGHMHGGDVQKLAAKIIDNINKLKTGALKTQNIRQKKLVAIGLYPRSIVLKSTNSAKRDFDLAIEHMIDLDKIHVGTYELEGEIFKVIKCL